MRLIASDADKIANDKMRIQYQERVFIIQAGAGFGCGMNDVRKLLYA
jgi:hypothetical protein